MRGDSRTAGGGGKQTAERAREVPEKAEVMKGEEEEVGKMRGKSKHLRTLMGLGSIPRRRNQTETVVFARSVSGVNHVTLFGILVLFRFVFQTVLSTEC